MSSPILNQDVFLPDLLRMKHLKDILKLSRSIIYAFMDPKDPRFDPTFPQSFEMSAGIVAWHKYEVCVWVQGKIAKSRGGLGVKSL